MIVLLLIGVVLCAATVVLLARAIVFPRLRAETGLAQIGAYGFPSEQAPDGEEDGPGPLSEALDRIAERLGGAMLPSFGERETVEVRGLLVSAGLYETTPGKFLGYRALSAASLTTAWLWLGSQAELSTFLFILIIPISTFIGWLMPLSLVRVRSDRRLDQVDAELPELIDSLVVTIEAGTGFGGALRLAARELRGPLSDEINLALQEQAMGLGIEGALENMAKRVNTPSMGSFVRSVLQGETLGVSIGEILRGLAVELRARRTAAAEEKAQKAPVKMLFPLAFCIFPAILIVLLYPAITELRSALGG